ncbi:MAG: permease-like cell division protein FtsX [Chitinophagaceae bacterium]
MAQSRKGSIKRGKPSYFMSVVGVTLVLFLLGIIGWLVINANKLGDFLKEKVEVRAYLRGDLNQQDSLALMNYISVKPYIRKIDYVTKEEGKKIYLSDGNEDWGKVLDANPLPNAIYFKVKNQYLNTDSLTAIQKDLEQQTYISDVQYPETLVGQMNENLQKISIYVLAIAIILCIVVIILIDNTIRLAMFSNRFLIKTMQMVGATRDFIARPMNIRAVINGALGGLLAAIAVFLMILFAEHEITGLGAIRDNKMLILLFSSLIIIGVFITLFSTHRSVIKYLKMSLDDLY